MINWLYMVMNSCLTLGSNVLLRVVVYILLLWCGQPRAVSAQHQNIGRGVQFWAGDHITDIWK